MEKALSKFSQIKQSKIKTTGLFLTGWGSSPVLNVGEKLHGIFAKGEEKKLM
jgi:hypothetical protein